MKKKISVFLIAAIMIFCTLPIVKTYAFPILGTNQAAPYKTYTGQIETPNTIDLQSSSNDRKVFIEDFKVQVSMQIARFSGYLGTTIPYPVYKDEAPYKLASSSGNFFNINHEISGYKLQFSSKESYKEKDYISFREVSYTITGNLVITDNNGNIISKNPLKETFNQNEWVSTFFGRDGSCIIN